MPKPHRVSSRKNRLDWKDKVGQALIGKLPPKPLKKAEISFVRYSYRFLDFDNLCSSFSNTLNALVTCGVLVDDSWGVIGKPEYDQVKVDRDQSRIKIMIAGNNGASGAYCWV